MCTTSLCSHVNTIYTKLVQLDKQIQTHCLYPHSHTDSVQINALEHDSDIDGQTDTLPDIQPKVPSHAENSEEDSALSLPIPKSTLHFHRIPIGLNLSLNQFRILQNTHHIRMLNNSGNNTEIAKDPN